MKMQAYIDEIKLSVTGGLLNLEIGDEVIQQIVNSAMRELQRYICSTKIITIPYSNCIDLTEYKPNSVVRVYRAKTLGGAAKNSTDPIQIGMWQLCSTGSMYNFNDYIHNYGAWTTLQQLNNTMSTDLSWYYEDAMKRLYINTTIDVGADITVEYIPRFDSVEDITSDYWIDILMRLSKGLTKVTLGRIRSRFNQSNALWTQDGDTLLSEGQQELSEVRAHLEKNTQLLYPID